MVIQLARQWWTQSNKVAMLASQKRLLEMMVPHLTAAPLVAAGINAVRLSYPSSTKNDPLVNDKRPVFVIAQGYGSGLGFFYSNVEAILRSGAYGSVVLVDWLGMGGSDRPPCRERPYRSLFQGRGLCEAHFPTTEQSINFFVDPLEQFMNHFGFDNDVCLVGHSLGGYLAARYALKYPSRISKLVLASPVGIPHKPRNALHSSQMPTTFRLLDSLWSANLTPQSLVRIQGATRGRRNVRRALRGRIPGLSETQVDLLADYLFHITVADPSGEYAMNSLLEPAISPDIMGVFAREPLEDQLVDLLDSNIDLRISFGDHDWMRTNEPSARKVVAALGKSRARLDIVPNAGHHLYLENNDEFVRTILT